MKLWKHTGPGHYMGCVVIVTAKTLEAATVLVRKQLDAWGWTNYPVKIEELVVKDGVVYTDSGDY